MKTELLDKNQHDRNGFDCGIEALNNYLKVMASQQAKKDNTRSYVLPAQQEDNAMTAIIGFYTLTMTTLDLKALPDNLQKKHQAASSAGLIARLAVDKRYKGQGYGEWLLIDALKRLLQASETVGFPLVIVDAKDGVSDFYANYGFSPFLNVDNKLFITMNDIRANLSPPIV